MQHLKDIEFVVIDVETTGLSPLQGDRVVEVSALKVKNFLVVDEFTTLIDPLRPLSYGAYLVNQISSDMLIGAPTFKQVLPQLTKFIDGSFMVGHNIKFDLKFIQYEYEALGEALCVKEFAIDTVKMARKLIPELRTFALKHVSTYLDININQLHRAKADVDLTYKIFCDLVSRANRKNILTIEDLIKYFGVPVHQKLKSL